MARMKSSARAPRAPTVPDAEILRQTRAARARQRALRKAGRVATAARYDAATERIVIDFASGATCGVPVRMLRELSRATPAQLAEVELDELGTGLRWEALDADISVPGLLMSLVGNPIGMRELARMAGRVRSDSKAAAARANGAKGGRPRKRRRRA
jgi:hypothetical protein